MGLYDTITIEKAYPEHDLGAGTTFKSKSLLAACGEFVITAEGKLVEKLFRFEHEPDESLMPPWRSHRIDTGEEVIEYHGDLHLSTATGEYKSFVVRFTHGRLEWLRPEQRYPQKNLDLLMTQGAR